MRPLDGTIQTSTYNANSFTITNTGDKVITRVVIDITDARDCPICLCPIQDNEEAAYAECGHAYHGDCFFRLLRSRASTCALCRALLFPEPPVAVAAAGAWDSDAYSDFTDDDSDEDMPGLEHDPYPDLTGIQSHLF